ncbi:MAG: zinc-ribbon domain-containing protein [Gloeobacterales cyanobacterium]
MAYACELGTGQRIYLDHQGTQTIVTTMSGGPGQQQQSSTGFHTGSWTTPPEIFQTNGGAVLKITTAQGEHFIYIQGSSMQVMGGVPSLSGSQQMQVQQVASVPTSSLPPMEPMKPMNMGGMQMSPMKPMEPMKPMNMGGMQMNPMEMRMGDMEMRMGSPTPLSTSKTPSPPDVPNTPAASGTTPSTRRFCSQCGTAVEPEDRFCSSCGHRLV